MICLLITYSSRVTGKSLVIHYSESSQRTVIHYLPALQEEPPERNRLITTVRHRDCIKSKYQIKRDYYYYALLFSISRATIEQQFVLVTFLCLACM